jgi:catalase (peroxidase I)
VTTSANICATYQSVSAAFNALLPAAGSSSANDFTRSNILAKALRLAFHDAGEADLTQSDTLGADGCLSATAENAGLIPFGSVTSTIVQDLFEPIYQQFCDKISRADLWAMLAWLAVSIASNGGVSMKYQYGRKDATSCAVPSTRLPSAQQGRGGISRVFVTQMGLTMNDAVTLSGAHSIGHVHPEFSGYGTAPTPTAVASDNGLITNAWDPTPQTFDATYYRSLVGVVRTAFNGS